MCDLQTESGGHVPPVWARDNRRQRFESARGHSCFMLVPWSSWPKTPLLQSGNHRFESCRNYLQFIESQMSIGVMSDMIHRKKYALVV